MGEPGRKGEKTPSVFPAGMLMAGLTCGRLTHGPAGFSEDQVLFGSSLDAFFIFLVNLLVTRRSPVQNPEHTSDK